LEYYDKYLGTLIQVNNIQKAHVALNMGKKERNAEKRAYHAASKNTEKGVV
jgi:hypothetical protein